MNLMDELKVFDQVLTSESGRFYCKNGIVQRFEPTSFNLIEGGIYAPQDNGNDMKHYELAVKTLIVPNGIKGFCDNFFRDGAVTDIFILPDSLESIGTNDLNSKGCVFAKSFLPEVVIPGNVKILGIYCFGGACIDKLVIRETTESPYLRQFKDARIKELYLPHSVISGNKDGDYDFYRNFSNHCNCRVIEY